MKFQQESIILNNEQDSISFAQTIAKNLESSEIITFSGDLGCGKTFICREIIKYFCGPATHIISPTFNLLQIYTTSKFTIYHFDLYRLNYLEEIYELGIEEAFQGNLCLIEWPELIEKILPRPITKIHLQILEGNKRSCSISYF
ncbi:tRNA (adenosine(37)-N6)-threonylcarbamoyltransferase complex ATPase subunit type 1 TsaE [Candidatus Tisiphia endosymbiont of Oplodontha viridula]|uniref:tRNA (adenosine(37)-N6)-threonylcarbamoyltransferase complex ATPase subunit type 1 TsaE n=1 Tax=Candidatus Tisiphia endosymbiont of Oplodontha viridula TaxID=3077925 RepID=UPI0035C9116F